MQSPSSGVGALSSLSNEVLHTALHTLSPAAMLAVGRAPIFFGFFPLEMTLLERRRRRGAVLSKKKLLSESREFHKKNV